MKNLRWYDKDKYLSAFMTLLQGLSDEIQSKVAIDILLYVPKLSKKILNNLLRLLRNTTPNNIKDGMTIIRIYTLQLKASEI